MSAPSSWIRAKANGWSSGCLRLGSATQVQVAHGAAGADRHQVGLDGGAGVGVVLERRAEHPVADAAGEDLAVAQRR